jgi:hypothetical protein
MKILSKLMNWNLQPADISKSKLFTASNDATHVTTERCGMGEEEVLQKLFSASNAGDNLKLYNGDTSNYGGDHSSADLAFVSKVAFYTQLPEQIDSIFRHCRLMRDKWDEIHSADGETYGEMTISKALADLNDTYSPPRSHKSKSGGFQLIRGSEIIKQSVKTDWLIEGFIPRDSTVLMFGEPESCKSMIALDMACCIGSDQDWAGNPVKQGDVVYIAGEGGNGLSKRLNALIQEKGLSVDHFHSSSSSMDLMSSESVDEVLKVVGEIEGLRLIIIDTLHRNSTGEESSSSDFAIVLQHCDQLRLVTGATIMMIHHSGHGNKNRSRGSSSIRGAMDAEFKVLKDGGVKLHCTKMKDDEKPKHIKFKLKSVTIGQDEDGKSITAPILEKSSTFFTADKPAALKATDELTLDILVHLSAKNSNPITKSVWRIACMEKYSVSPDSHNPDEAKRRKFDRCLKSLFDKGIVIEDNGCCSIPNSDSDADNGAGSNATTEGGD